MGRPLRATTRLFARMSVMSSFLFIECLWSAPELLAAHTCTPLKFSLQSFACLQITTRILANTFSRFVHVPGAPEAAPQRTKNELSEQPEGLLSAHQ